MTTIRMAEPADGAQVAEIYAPVVASTAISFETEVPSAQEMTTRITTALTFAPWLVCVDGGRVTAYAYASKHRDRAAYRWSVDVSVYVREGNRGGGLGRALYTSLFELLREQGFYAAHAGIALPNDASVRLHESMGFRPVGVYPKVGFKLGRWHDTGWWQLALRERAGAPAPTLTLETLRRSAGYDRALAAGLARLSP